MENCSAHRNLTHNPLTCCSCIWPTGDALRKACEQWMMYIETYDEISEVSLTHSLCT